jgi:hypothetical protein
MKRGRAPVVLAALHMAPLQNWEGLPGFNGEWLKTASSRTGPSAPSCDGIFSRWESLLIATNMSVLNLRKIRYLHGNTPVIGVFRRRFPVMGERGVARAASPARDRNWPVD